MGRGTPAIANSNAVLLSLDVALGSLMLPSVCAVTTPCVTLTSMPSKRSIVDGSLLGPAIAAVNSTGKGNVMPFARTVTLGETNSVVGVALVPANSSTVPTTRA